MEKMNKDGLLLCELQAAVFEESVSSSQTSSGIFARRFMKSTVAGRFDDTSILESNYQAKDILQMIVEEYGESSYGSVKYTCNEMYWIGYLYRYFSFTYRLTSSQVYRIIKPKELRELYLPYHALDPAQAIERILEAKHMLFDEEVELKRQYEIFKRIRNSKTDCTTGAK